jgi:uncharacterized membrane protein
MVLWGVIWGAVLGFLWRSYSAEAQVIVGALLGGIAGFTLRAAVRNELRAQQALAAKPQQPAAVAAPVATPPQPIVAAASAPVAVPAASAPATVPRPALAAASKRPAAPEWNLAAKLFSGAWDWLFGGNTVVRMGVVVLFIGLAFLARYAVENALLPPELRLAGIGALGIALFVFGLRMHRRGAERRGYSLTLQGAGVAVLYLTVFAAFRLYQFLPAAAAFAALGLICLFSAIIALALDALPLAFIGFAGGFAAPVLVSTGQGDHVGLFSYYLLLGAAIAVIAWKKAWRPLNLLGFFATFGVATAWGVLKYRPEQFASTEPFLVAFFLVYLLASLFYALRHGQAARKAVDATLVFGTPIAAFGLQAGLVRDTPYATAFSSLALGLVYVLLGWWAIRRRSGDPVVNRWLAECFTALALGFITLAVPLALDGRWTSAVWAVEGAGVYWMGRRQGRWLARATGIALQALGAALYLEGSGSAGTWPIANPAFVGAAMLAFAAMAIAWWSREPVAIDDGSRFARAFAPLENALSPVLFWIGFLWWMGALGMEIGRATIDAQGNYLTSFDQGERQLLHMAGWVLSAFALHRLALPQRALPWTIAATPAWLTIVVMLMVALVGMASRPHVFQGGGWVAWPLVIVLHLVMLRRLDAGKPQAWWPWVHAGGVWLLVLLSANVLVFAIGKADLWRTAWATVILLAAATLVLAALVQACRRAMREGGAGSRWPLDRFVSAYAWRAAAPIALGLAAGALLVAVYSRGESRPLPYIPLLNPTDLAVALALAVCALWLVRMRQSTLPVPAVMRGPAPVGALAAISFIAVNTVWLRVAHHWGAVPWDGSALYASFLVQAGYSILWTLIALVLMVGAHRRAMRAPWMLGAGLLGLTVLKLFVVDLSNRGGSERIVVFIAVGLLMLVVGWFAPLPPTASTRPRASAPDLQGAAP